MKALAIGGRRIEPDGKRRAACFALAAAFHTAVVWWVFSAAALQDTPPPLVPVLMIDLTPPPAQAPPPSEPGSMPPHVDLPPQPLRQVTQPQVMGPAPKKEEAKPAPRPQPKAKSAPPKSARVAIQERSKPGPAQAPEAAPATVETSLPAAASAPVAAQPIDADAGTTPVTPGGAPTWQGLVLGRLERFKRYPSEARFRRQEGVATVRFTMDRRGRVVSAKLEKSSGFGSLDEEAVALVHRAEPLPAPPPEVQGDPIELVVPVQFFSR
jgi:protein TonB